jgi:hypothetical protein
VKCSAASLLVAIAIAAVPASAQSLADLERVEQFDEVLDLIGRAQAELETVSRQRRTDCMKATGHTRFCVCIGDKLAVAWSFADYVAITTRTKEENGYGTLDGEMRSAYDNVALVRDECVALSVHP